MPYQIRNEQYNPILQRSEYNPHMELVPPPINPCVPCNFPQSFLFNASRATVITGLMIGAFFSAGSDNDDHNCLSDRTIALAISTNSITALNLIYTIANCCIARDEGKNKNCNVFGSSCLFIASFMPYGCIL